MNQLPPRFYVVTKPRRLSVKIDILFETDLPGLELQFKGGLTAEEIHGIYTKSAEANREADRLLQEIRQ